ncbi:MAG: DUF3152 domain-containing protein [Nocardioides sp.]|nr:DUF3152 domain-containing protein [Nocardioides sp.]
MLARALALALCATAWFVTPAAASGVAAEPVSTRPPAVEGSATVGKVLRSGRGGWEPSDVTVAFQWLRDGKAIAGATSRGYRIDPADLRHRLSVRLTATSADGGTGTATSEPTERVVRGRLVNRRQPGVIGTKRFTHTVEASLGRWSRTPGRVAYQWLRGNRPIPGATHRRYRYVPEDVGRRVRVRVLVRAAGYHPATAVSPRAEQVAHRVDVRRTVTYHVETRGRISTSVREFARQAQQTFSDPRGWRGKGVRFVRVERRGSFTLVLAEASRVPGFSSGCSSEWSCRVGRYVIINQTRWKHASPAWNRAKGALRDYRHMVVNHETGHWLGRGHVGCPGKGRLAPVMMQQSKDLGGCRFNPWPTRGELR